MNKLQVLTNAPPTFALLAVLNFLARLAGKTFAHRGKGLVITMLLAAVQAHAAPLSTVQLEAGRVDYYPFSQGLSGTNSFQVYVPSSYDGFAAWPLVVVLHGCLTSADQMMHSSQMNEVADKGRFLVAYLDNGSACWRALFSDRASLQRGAGGDADKVAGMTKRAMSLYKVDAERVYLIGMSAGAFQTTATAAAYPDIYAAVGVNAGGPYQGSLCLALPDLLAPTYALRALDQMGARARIIPFISFGGTSDPVGESVELGGCARSAFYAAMNQNNTVDALNKGKFWARAALASNPSGQLVTGSYALDPTSTVNGQVPNGYTWTTKVWRDSSRCLIGEEWIVNGMAHYWSGGSTDPQYAGRFNDPKGPNSGQAAWDFFSRYRKSETGKACSESRTGS